jgi:membrane protease YdiL (CAAX protease family)
VPSFLALEIGMQDDSTNGNRQPRRGTWTGSEIVFSVFLAWLFWPAVMYATLKGIGVEHWYYGDDAPELSKRLNLWARTLALPFQILTYPLVFSAYSGTTLEQLGLTTRRLGRNILAGVAGVMLMGPLVYAVWKLVRLLSEASGGDDVQEHVLETLARLGLTPSEWGMVFFTAMIGAPLHEELAFRGVLQPWLAERRWGGHVAMLGGLALSVAFRGERLWTAWAEGIPNVSLVDAATPALFVLALLPLYLAIWATSRTPLDAAIFGTSLMFACIHTSVWPTPMPLLVLALGLGVLAQRRRSLVGPIVLHGLFNGVSCIQLLVLST